MMRYILALVFSVFCSMPFLNAQGIGVPFGSHTYHILDRLQIKSGVQPSFHSSHKLIDRKDILEYALQLDSSTLEFTDLDRSDLTYLLKDNNEYITNKANNKYYFQREKPILKYFYDTESAYLQVDEPNFSLRLNPIIYEQVGGNNNDSAAIFQDVKGVEARMLVDDKISFYFNLFVHGGRFNDYVRNRIDENGEMPYAGLFKSSSADGLYTTLYGKGPVVNNYITSQGHVSFNATKHIQLQFGHGKAFLGNGYRSLFISDYSNNHFYLKASTRVWKFDYQNYFAELTTISRRNSTGGDVLLPKKFLAMHHLSYNVFDWLNIGLFEATMSYRDNQFPELQFFNPIILYRAVEHSLGSPDNAMVGADFNANLFGKASIYGQLVLDELKFDELFGGNGWWANKYGVQLGLKYIDVANIDHLDVQLEYNMVRPYIYSHRDGENQRSFTHFSQPLAHPLGANFTEGIAIIRYQPTEKIFLQLRMISANKGLDTLGSNWGGNIFLNHSTREQNYDNTIGQGVNTDIVNISFTASYQLWHNIFADLDIHSRNQNSVLDAYDLQTTYVGVGLRWNAWARPYDF